VEFSDGYELEYAANIIAESMYAQAGTDGNQYLLLAEITGHKKDSTAVPIENVCSMERQFHKLGTTQRSEGI
jgi:hypothetical protein